MNTKLTNSLLAFAVPALVLALSACGTRTETEKTTIIERKVESPASAVESESGHLQRAGEKIDAKVDRKIDEAIDDAIGE
jgi:hypothetical protein